jgi:hypothetical protein
MTAAWTDVPLATLELSGSNAFRLMPEDDLFEAPATATVRSAAGGHALVVAYTWEHADDGPQDGVLLVSSPDDDGIVHATLMDSWHQKPGPMHLTGRLLEDGSGASVSAVYYQVYEWEVDVRPVDGGLELDMRNVVPDGGTYDVMLLRVR